MSSERVAAAVAQYRAAAAELVGRSFEEFTHPELLDLLQELETVHRKMPVIGHRILARLQREASPVAQGAKSWKAVLMHRLRVSAKDAARRLAEATDLGPRAALTGEPLAPLLAQTAAAQAAGVIGVEHVTVLGTFLTDLPYWVDVTTREQAEDTLVTAAIGLGPDELGKAAAHLAVLIDQDGPNEPVRAKVGAPGMANPEDCTPRASGTPSQEQIDGDHRSAGQRTHDAFTAIGRNALASGELGQHNGLPVTVIVSTTLQDLQSAAGSAVTGGGSLLPDGRPDPNGQPRHPLPAGVRQALPPGALSRPGQTSGLGRSADRPTSS